MYYISDNEGAGWASPPEGWSYLADEWTFFKTYEEAEKENKEQELDGTIEEV